MHTLRFGPLNDCLNLLRRGLDSTRADFKTEVIQLVLQKLALVKSPIQLSVPELFQGLPKVLPMLVQIPTEYQDVVQAYCDEFSIVVSEDLVHQPLERGKCVAQPKWHDKKLKWPLLYKKVFFGWMSLPSQSGGI